MYALIANGGEQENFDDEVNAIAITPLPAGVLVKLVNHSEVLFPWHRVIEVGSETPGAVAEHLNNKKGKT